MWFTIFEPLNDRVGQAMCQGSGWLVRRSALEDIGGWPIAQTGEDVMCALKLLHHGWKLSYVREYLQHGRTADTFGARVTQKIRWVGDTKHCTPQNLVTNHPQGHRPHRIRQDIRVTLYNKHTRCAYMARFHSCHFDTRTYSATFNTAVVGHFG